MKISSVSNVSFKDRQIEEFGETIITSPKTTQLDENKKPASSCGSVIIGQGSMLLAILLAGATFVFKKKD